MVYILIDHTSLAPFQVSICVTIVQGLIPQKTTLNRKFFIQTFTNFSNIP